MDDFHPNILNIVVNGEAFELIKDGRARWIYCGEGNNNIAVIYNLLDSSTAPDDVVSLVHNKVFRVRKVIKAQYIGKVIPDEVEYSQLFDRYIAQKDPELAKYTLGFEEITLSHDVVASIEDHIMEARYAIIAEARIMYPTKTFQGIDKDLRFATVMENLSSSNSPCDDGVIKHAELKLGLIIPKPMQKSFIEYLKSTYTVEQCESTDYFKNRSRFTAKQATLVVTGKADNF